MPLLGGGDPAGVLYSFTLYERSAMANAVRVQVDSGDRPLDLNDGAKLELGSTAKLRTLVTYLELMAQLHDRYAGAERAELEQALAQEPDRLTAFVLETLLASRDRSLDALLEAAMLRKYSASPWEGFFTGGGLHYFQNFDEDDNGRILTVRDAFHRSVNLVFIRLMRDLVEHHRARLPDAEAGVLDDPEHPLRESYLDRFADREGADFVRRFYREHRGESADQLLGSLVVAMRPIPKRIAAAHRSTRPDAPFDAFDRFLRARLPRGAVDEPMARLLYQQLSPERMSLSDRGYVARVHPLELWVIEYLSRHPDATLDRGARRQRGRAAGGLRVAAPQRPQDRTGPPHPHAARHRGLRRDPPRLAPGRLSVRLAGAVLRHRHRQLRRSALGAGRAARNPGQRRRAPADRAARALPLRRRHAVRDRARARAGRRASRCSIARSPWWRDTSSSAWCAAAPPRARARRSSSPTVASSTSAARPAPATTASSATASPPPAPA